MELETLQKWRHIIPGVMIVLFVTPLGQQTLTVDAFFRSLTVSDNILRGAGVIICGTLYYLLPLRNYFLQGSLAQMHENIKSRLLEPCLDDPQIAAAEQKLRRGRTIFDIFYPLIDNDATLKEKAKLIRFNGLIWSSTADLTAIAMVMTLMYWVATLFLEPRIHYVWLAGFFALIPLLTMGCLMSLITRRHITLSDEQLDYIQGVLSAELCGRMKALAAKLNSANYWALNVHVDRPQHDRCYQG